MWQKKHENSKIKAIRLPSVVDDFLREVFVKNPNSEITANDFVLNLITNSDEYKKYIQRKTEDSNKNQPSLFGSANGG